jgi:hypothetical protein
MASNFPSSNPFRRKGAADAPPAPQESPSSTKHIAYQQAYPPLGSSGLEAVDVPKKITKKVRVQSPPPPSPSIPDSASTIGEESFLYSAKPPTPVPRKDDPFDSITSDTSEDEASSRPRKAPANPFSKTLETMERPDAEREGPVLPSTSVSSPGRASMDVEAFKRLLMTGNAGLGLSTTSPPTQAQVAHHALGDGGSSTDTSSISRQSIFEAIQEAHAESPRTSHEISEPDDDRRGLTGDFQPSLAGRKKPPPPSSRHGKLIKVDLRDEPPTNTVQSPSTPGSITSQNYFSSSPVHSNRSLTDLNKPLPPAPNRASHDSDRESIFDKESAGKTPEPPSPSTSIRRKTPPAPPLARRHSQLVSDSKITRSNSGRLSPRVEEDNVSIAATESGRPRSDSGRAPPPPPSRRPASIRGFSHHLPLSSPSTVSLPAPPPTRGSSRHSSSGRPPSVISLDLSTSNSKRASIVPPPPPPHRHGQQAQSPGASRRASGEQRRSMDNVRRDSESSSVSKMERIESNPGGHDILADLSALQNEIDALRTQSGNERVT